MLWLRRIDSAPSWPATLTILVESRPVEVSLRRRAGLRRMTLRVSGATGQVTLSLPDRASVRVAQTFLAKQSGWIAERLARVPARVAFNPGSTVPLRGVPHEIVHRPAARRRVDLGTGPAGDPAIAVAGDLPGVPGRVRRFLAAEAARDLREAVDRHAAAAGARVARLTVRDTVSRWGSCSSAGALSFSWRLILAPPFVLDYLAAHEVAHLRELNHSDRFWRLVRELYPEVDAAEGWLKRNGTGLHRYG